MLKEKQEILFVSHAADRNGAPLILLGIIKEFQKQSDLPFRILLMKDGDLAGEFKAAGRTFIWNRKPDRRGSSLMGRLVNYVSGMSVAVKNRYILSRIRNSRLVFFNTIVNGDIQEKLLFLNCKFICYVHELGAAIHSATNAHTLNVVLKHTHFFLTGSEAVKKNLTGGHGVKENTVKVVYSSLTDVFSEKANYAGFIASFKNKHHIPADAVIIGVAASNEWRKGFDLFLPLVRLYRNLYPESNVYFVWKGFKEKNPSAFYDLYDYRKFNMSDRVMLIPHGSDNIDQMACFDIHLLLSREDPYPLVVLEAASFGIPSVCFSDAGGSPEFIETDSGYCVPYGDLYAMAMRLNELAENRDLRNRLGLSAQKKVKDRHHQKEATLEVIQTIESIL